MLFSILTVDHESQESVKTVWKPKYQNYHILLQMYTHLYFTFYVFLFYCYSPFWPLLLLTL